MPLLQEENNMRLSRAVLNFVFVSVMALTVCSNALAASYDIKEMTPEVKSALDARRGRFDQLAALKAEGKVGENNQGYVEVLSGGGVGAESLVSAENSDRKMIYKTIVAQNGLPGDALSTVEKVFAQVQRDKAASGDSIQNESGAWVKK
jgi:uncharacterized protein YdbL (DUF1318 family)